MVAEAPKALCCGEKYGITVRSEKRHCRRCPKPLEAAVTSPSPSSSASQATLRSAGCGPKIGRRSPELLPRPERGGDTTIGQGHRAEPNEQPPQGPSAPHRV